MRAVFASLIVFFSALGTAFSSEMLNYAYGIKAEGSFNEDGVYIFSIPLQVYERVTDAKLGDIAIFNAAGERVPFTVVRPKVSSYTQPEDAQIVFYKETYESDNKTLIKHLIANISDISGNIKSIRFLFNSARDFTGHISISYSLGDIGNFSNASYGVSLANLGDIIQDKIEISQIPEKAKYLRITGDKVILEAITGAILSFREEPVYDRVEKVILNGNAVGRNNLLDFKLTGYYPVEFISLKAAEAYLFNEVAINTAEGDNSSDTSYKPLDRYPVLKDVSGYAIKNARTRRIRIKFEDPLPSDTSASFYWRADDIVFIAKGAPFTLAYGNILEKGKPAATYEQLAKTSGAAKRIELSANEFIIAGEKALIPPPEEKHTARKVILLSLMAEVVLVVSAVAVRLLIKGGNDSSPTG